MPRKSLHQKATSTISDRIAKAMPGVGRAIASADMDYVLAHSFRAATMTIDELAEATGVSVATANRFAHTLGFSGFPLSSRTRARIRERAGASGEDARRVVAQA